MRRACSPGETACPRRRSQQPLAADQPRNRQNRLMPAAVDIDAVMAEVRERVRRKRESGIYGAEVDAILQAPLPGGPALFVDELADPLAVLPAYLGGEVRYDPRSTRGVLAPLITYVRRSLIWLLRWWMQAVVERQDRINRLIVR